MVVRRPTAWLSVLACVQVVDAVHRNKCERAVVASPRTIGCSIKEQQMEAWRTFHRKLADEVAAYSNPTGAQRLWLVGDSITEAWRGTAYGEPVMRTRGIAAMLNATLSAHWPEPLVCGISADETQHVLWRLRNGEVSPTMSADKALTAVLLIGTNNIGNARHSTTETAAGVVAVAGEILQRIAGRLFVNAILPRGKSSLPRQKRSKHYASMLQAIDETNSRINASLRPLSRSNPGRLQVVDCGSFFRNDREKIAAGESEVIPGLMPDGVHPSARGHAVWAACLERFL